MENVYKLIDPGERLSQVNCSSVTHWKQVNSSETFLVKLQTSNGFIIRDIVKYY